MQEQFNNIALSLSIPAVSAIALIALIGWAALGAVYYEKMRRIGSAVFMIVALVILFITVFSRTRIDAAFHPIPFSTFQRAQTDKKLYVFMIMNLIMFMPVGLSLPFVFYGKTGRRIMWTIFVGLLFSVLIELVQMVFSIGYADIDDVIINTLGTAVGCLSYPLSLLFLKIKRKSK